MRLHDSLEYWAHTTPDADCAVFGGQRLSYAAADARANRIAHALVAAGLEVGERVAILAKNCADYALFYYAASKAGVVPVPLNYRLAPPEWAFIVGDAGAKLLIAQGDLAAAIDPVRAELPALKRAIAIGAAPAGWEEWEEFLAGHSEAPPDRADRGRTTISTRCTRAGRRVARRAPSCSSAPYARTRRRSARRWRARRANARSSSPLTITRLRDDHHLRDGARRRHARDPRGFRSGPRSCARSRRTGSTWRCSFPR
jgi:acyl-CoA synthetase (AMP-forming)/AMP-acid ligase II